MVSEALVILTAAHYFAASYAISCVESHHVRSFAGRPSPPSPRPPHGSSFGFHYAGLEGALSHDPE